MNTRQAHIIGIVLAVIGATYALWSASQFRATPAETARAFDRPFADGVFATLTGDRPLRAIDRWVADRERLLRMKPATTNEAYWRDEVVGCHDSLRVFVICAMRICVGLLVFIAGVIMVSHTGTQRPLLAIIAKLEAVPPGAVPGR